MMTTYGMISTYPPADSGLARFTDGLRTGLLSDHAEEVLIVRVGESPHGGDAAEVVAWLTNGRSGLERAIAALNRCDVVLIQLEHGVYGDAEGRDVQRVAEAVQVPAIAVLHTVPAEPDQRQRQILEDLAEKVDAIVVMSDAAADRLLAGYALDAAKIAVIPHGADVSPAPADWAHTDWAAVSAGYGLLASLLEAEKSQLVA